MAAATRTRGRVPPPPRGRPYYDAVRGERLILPRGGGKAIPYVEGGEQFSARRALRRAGMRAGTATAGAADRGAARAQQGLVDLGSVGFGAAGGPGIGSLLIWAFATLLALALLENMLGGRGPAAVEKILGVLGGGITKLVSPTDPIIPRGLLQASSPASTSSGGGTSTGAATAPSSTPRRVSGSVTFTGASLAGVKPGLISAVTAAAKAAGVTIIDVISGKRTPAHNAAVGGVPGSNHLTGDAIDGRAFIPGFGWVPLGDLPGLAAHGIRSGDQPGFFHGNPDPNHVDTGL